MASKSIAILGTRGIPNRYGGFEQFAEHVSVGLVSMGYDVIVYNPDFHPFKEASYQGVKIVHKWCPESKIGAAAHIIYDFLCLRDAVNRQVDVVLELGYQSSALSMLVCSFKRARVITNMDGMEWQRQKWSPMVKRFTRWAEKVGVARSHALVADNLGIQDYLMSTYRRESVMIPYGAEVFDDPDISVLSSYSLTAFGYYILIARMEPENNVETVLDGYIESGSAKPFIVVGNVASAYGKFLIQKYSDSTIRFVGGIYDIGILNNLRYFAHGYFHGHSVGGTNPSLLEAMASHAMIVAHNNIFNRSVLGTDAYYFESSKDIAEMLVDRGVFDGVRQQFIQNNLDKIRNIYRWDLIVQQYADLFERVINESSDHHAG